MGRYAPSMLPPVTGVEVVALDHIDSPGVRNYLWAAVAAPRATVEGSQARRIAELWRQLPSGTQARCHIPPFGLRFFVTGAVVCEASICWECNNIYGKAGGTPFCYEFDALADVAKTLLGELQRVPLKPAAGWRQLIGWLTGRRGK